jgi:hypothetical protein
MGTRGRLSVTGRRDQDLVAAGHQVVRVTWRQIRHQPLLVAARIAQALAR